MLNQVISANRVRVIVNGSVFEIPSEKVGELQGILARWQSIGIKENSFQQPQNQQYSGQSLILG